MKLLMVSTTSTCTNTESVPTGGGASSSATLSPPPVQAPLSVQAPPPMQAPPSIQSPPPTTLPPQHPPEASLPQGWSVPMEAEPSFPKRQLSGGEQMAVRQPPRPMPGPPGESLHGVSMLDFVKTNFRALGPPRRGDEKQGAYMEQLMPTVNAITLLNQTGTVQGSQMSPAGSGPFGMSQHFGQPGERRVAEPLFVSQDRQRPPGHFNMPGPPAPTVPPRAQLDAGTPAWSPEQPQPSQPGWHDGNDPWRAAAQQSHQQSQDPQGQGYDSWQWYGPNCGQGQDSCWGMVNTTTKEQTKEINTVLNNMQAKFGGNRNSFDT